MTASAGHRARLLLAPAAAACLLCAAVTLALLACGGSGGSGQHAHAAAAPPAPLHAADSGATPGPPPAAPAAAALRHASLVVAVTSKAGSHRRRAWVRGELRRSLALLARRDPGAAAAAVVVFVVGLRGLPPGAAANLSAEHAASGDMLLLPDTPDADAPDPPPPGADSATCLKVVRAAAWAVARYEFAHFVRLGDDSFFRIDYFLADVAPALPRARLLLGYCPPSLRYTFPSGAAVRYCSGMGFVLSADAVAFLAAAAGEDMLAMPWPEDAAVALWLAGTRVETTHDERFHDWEWRRCSNRSIIVHKHRYGGVDAAGVMTDCFPQTR
ncbi:B3galt6 [Scenedesmus sp. PABB004]|nr:B3galt6 [Scenedesmus sp. PABB004]